MCDPPLMCDPPSSHLSLLLSLLLQLLLLLMLLPFRLLLSPVVVAETRQDSMCLGQVLLHLLAAVEDWAVPRCAQHILQVRKQICRKHRCRATIDQDRKPSTVLSIWSRARCSTSRLQWAGKHPHLVQGALAALALRPQRAKLRLQLVHRCHRPLEHLRLLCTPST